MNIKYSRLINENVVNFDYVRWAKSRIPVGFLQQQIPLVTLVVASFILLIFTRLFVDDEANRLSPQHLRDVHYGVIVDCGSSGSRAHIFKWREMDEKIRDLELVRNDQTGSPLNLHIEPGLSTLREAPETASDYMEPIMKFITKTIPADKHLSTPVYFMATAGLRLLEDSIQRKILADITRDLRVKYDFPKIRSQVITGEYEGIYSWLALNINNINKAEANSYGMIEMGGASTQVTFEVKPEIENTILKGLKHPDAITTFKSEQITLGLGRNKSVRLFATTFLGLGVNSARESAIDILVRDYLNGTGELGTQHLLQRELTLKDPCLTLDSSEIVSRPREVMTFLNQSVGFLTRKQSDTFRVRLEGSGNFLNCLVLLERVLRAVKDERLNCQPSKQSCPNSLLGNEFIPYESYQFIGLSEMFFTTNEMINSAGPFNRLKILNETNRICGTSYNKLHETYSHGGVSHQDRILYECFKASWLLTILHDYGFRMPNSYDNFKTVEQLDGREIDWTMGAMFSELVLNGKPR